jgi:DNA-binding NarL/FixJ family response regulator
MILSTKNGVAAIRIMLVAVSPVRRAGLESLLTETPALKFEGSVANTRNFMQQAIDSHANVVLADVDSESFRNTLASLPASLADGLPIVALIDDPRMDWVAQVLRSSVRAILPRDSESNEIAASIQAVHAGLSLVDAEVMRNIIAHLPRSAGSGASGIEELTPRELEVLRMLAEGMGNREMAVHLGVTGNTVKFHISSILDKLDAESRTEAVTIGIRSGLILL